MALALATASATDDGGADDAAFPFLSFLSFFALPLPEEMPLMSRSYVLNTRRRKRGDWQVMGLWASGEHARACAWEGQGVRT